MTAAWEEDFDLLRKSSTSEMDSKLSFVVEYLLSQLISNAGMAGWLAML